MSWAETFSLCRDILIAIIDTRSLHGTLYKRVLTKNTKRNLSKSFRFHTCHKMDLRVSKEKPNQKLQKDWAMYNLRSSNFFSCAMSIFTLIPSKDSLKIIKTYNKIWNPKRILVSETLVICEKSQSRPGERKKVYFGKL